MLRDQAENQRLNINRYHCVQPKDRWDHTVLRNIMTNYKYIIAREAVCLANATGYTRERVCKHRLWLSVSARSHMLQHLSEQLKREETRANAVWRKAASVTEQQSVFTLIRAADLKRQSPAASDSESDWRFTSDDNIITFTQIRKTDQNDVTEVFRQIRNDRWPTQHMGNHRLLIK